MRKKITLFSLFFVLVAALLVSTLIPISSASVSDFEITPENPVKGDIVKIAGTASADEQVPIELSFEEDLSVASGKYEWLLPSLEIPKGENRFTVTATNVKTLNVALEIFFWYYTRVTDADENGFAIISQSNVPGGDRDAKISGKSVSESGTVKIKVEAKVYLTADANGDFEYSYDTSPIPLGEFKVKVGDGSARTIELLETRPTSTPTPTPTPTPTSTPTLPASGSGGSSGGGGGGGGASLTITPTPTPTPTPTITDSNDVTVTPSLTSAPMQSPNQSPTPTSMITPTVTPMADFSITVDPTHVNVKPGDSITFKITMTPIGDFDAPIELNLSIKAPRYNKTYSLPTQYPPFPKTYTYILNIPENAAHCTVEGTVTATGCGKTHAGVVTVKIPGFEAVFAIAVLLAVAYLVLRKKK